MGPLALARRSGLVPRPDRRQLDARRLRGPSSQEGNSQIRRVASVKAMENTAITGVQPNGEPITLELVILVKPK
jgi:hypothetical protein